MKTFPQVNFFPVCWMGMIFFALMMGCNNGFEPNNPDQQDTIPDQPVGTDSFIPIAVQVLNVDPNAKPDTSYHPQAVSISITDTNGQLLSSTGQSFSEQAEFETQVGVANLKLPVSALELSGTGLYSFTIAARAPGFLDVIKTVTVSNPQPTFIQLFMVPDDPGISLAGIDLVRDDFPVLPNGQVQGTISKIIGTVNNVSNQPILTAQIIIPEGTTLLNETRTAPINGAVGRARFNLSLFDPRSEIALRTFPGDFFWTDAVNLDGENIATLNEPAFFKTSGFLDLEITVGNQVVGGFDKSATLILTINDQSNELGLDKLDNLPLWHLEEQGTSREIERAATKEIEPGVFEYRYTVEGVEDLIAGEVQTYCSTTIQVENPGGFKTRYISASTVGLLPRLSNGNVVNLIDNSVFDVQLEVPENEVFDFRVHETCSISSTSAVEDRYDACLAGAITVPEPATVIGCEKIEIQITCPENGNCYTLDAVGLNFGINSLFYNYAGSFTDGQIYFDLNKMGNGNLLNFLIWFGNGTATPCNGPGGSVCYIARVCLPPCTGNVPLDQIFAAGAQIVTCQKDLPNSEPCDKLTIIRLELTTNCDAIFGPIMPGDPVTCIPDQPDCP